MINGLLTNTAKSVIDIIPDKKLQDALTQAFEEAADSVRKCENFFQLIPTQRWSDKFLATFFSTWKATHLKMLAIYGLSCRLQRLALAADVQAREELMLSSAYNAETSYEDLGLDYEGVTHTQLYEDLASSFLGNYPWQLEEYCLPKAQEFKNWIYRNMVVGDITTGLLTNMFSEIYNHAEYTTALASFSQYVDAHCNFSAQKKENALTYIHAHVVDETEINHFLVVVKALDAYNQATNKHIDYEQAKALFKSYLTRLGLVMEELTVAMEQEINESNRLLCVS